MEMVHEHLSATQVFLRDESRHDLSMTFFLEPSTKHGPISRRHVQVVFLAERVYAGPKTIVTVHGSDLDGEQIPDRIELFRVDGADSFLVACNRVIRMLEVLDIANEPFVSGDELATVVNAFTVPHHGGQSA